MIWSSYNNWINSYLESPRLDDGSLQSWQDRFFKAFVRFLLPVSLVIVVPSVIMLIKDDFITTAIANMLSTILIFVIIFNRSTKFQTKKIFILGVIYILSAILFISMGMEGPGLVFLLGISVFNSLLIGNRAGYYSIIVNAAIYIVCGISIYYQLLDPVIFFGHSGSSWLIVGIDMLALNIALIVTINSLINGLLRTSKRLKEETSRLDQSLKYQKSINEISMELGKTLDLKAIYSTLYMHVSEIMTCDTFIVSLYDSKEQLISAKYANDAGKIIDVSKFPPIPIAENSEGKQSKVIAIGESLYVADWLGTIQNHDTHYSIDESGKVQKKKPSVGEEDGFTKSGIFSPMNIAGEVIGILQVQSQTIDDYSPDKIELLNGIANVAAIAIQNSKLYQKLEIALDEAMQASKVKDLFMENMSHEIRTPLNSFLGFVEIIKDQITNQDYDGLDEHFKTIHHSGQRLIKTVHGILDISQIETGTILFSREIIPLALTVEQIYKELKPQAEAKKLKIMFDNQIDDGVIKADVSLLIKAVSNIVENAIKYTEAGEIVLTLFEQVGHYGLSISDTGIGMNPDYMKHMYDTFTQESAGYTKKYQGLGLGLSIAKRCLDLMEIDIDVESKKGVGTTFRLTFTGAEAVDTVGDKPVKANPKVIEAVEIERPMVLIVEDDENSRKVLEVQLKSTYQTCYSVSVDGAKKQLKDHAVDLVLLDLALEGEATGLDLVAYMKTKDKLKDIPIIVVTAHAFTIDRENALNAGCEDYLSKPINREKLLEKISKLV